MYERLKVLSFTNFHYSQTLVNQVDQGSNTRVSGSPLQIRVYTPLYPWGIQTVKKNDLSFPYVFLYTVQFPSDSLYFPEDYRFLSFYCFQFVTFLLLTLTKSE